MWGVRKQASKHSANDWHSVTNFWFDVLSAPQRTERPAQKDPRHAHDRLSMGACADSFGVHDSTAAGVAVGWKLGPACERR